MRGKERTDKIQHFALRNKVVQSIHDPTEVS